MNETHFNSFANTSDTSSLGDSNRLGPPSISGKEELDAMYNTDFYRYETFLNGRDTGSAEEAEDVTETEEFIPESEAMTSAEAVASLAAPAAIGALALNNATTSQQIASDTQKDQSGQGLAGNTFATNFQQREDIQHDQTVGLENTALIAGGSLFGPEGTAVGMIAAGANSAFNQASEATVTSNLGTQVPVSSLT